MGLLMIRDNERNEFKWKIATLRIPTTLLKLKELWQEVK